MEPKQFFAPESAHYPQYQVWLTAEFPSLYDVRLYTSAEEFTRITGKRVTQEALDTCQLLNSTLGITA